MKQTLVKNTSSQNEDGGALKLISYKICVTVEAA
jgi:hypothetical protein